MRLQVRYNIGLSFPGQCPILKMLSSSWQRVLLSDPQLQQGQPVGLVNVQRIGICLGALHRSKSLLQCRGRLRCIGRVWLRACLHHNVSLRLVVHAPQSLANGSRCIVGVDGIHNGRIGITFFLRDNRLRDFCSGFDLHLRSPHIQRPNAIQWTFTFPPEVLIRMPVVLTSSKPKL
nr:MAG TPA: hypothetical protein [Caudoviricetes sp.]